MAGGSTLDADREVSVSGALTLGTGIKLEGDIPSPANPPKGCRFHTRCPYAKEICKHVPPQYREHEPGHYAACHLLDEK